MLLATADLREIWGDMGRYGEIWGDMGGYGELVLLLTTADLAARLGLGVRLRGWG